MRKGDAESSGQVAGREGHRAENLGQTVECQEEITIVARAISNSNGFRPPCWRRVREKEGVASGKHELLEPWNRSGEA